ncbi:MAG TPA: SusD/RagB family nutrient-binding outer membrane lipoprotein [Bacteroidales bacterium]
MKKYIFLILALFTITLVSCDKFVKGYDVSPNSASDATLPLLLSATELGLETSYTGNPVRESSIFMQQIAGTDQQMLAIAEYALTETDNVNDWNNIYNVVVQTSNNIIQKAGTKNPYYVGIAEVLKAMGLGLATDTWGDVPASEAGMGIINGNLTPKFDTQQNVIIYIQQLLSDALTQFATTSSDNLIVPGSDDFMLQGDISKWINVTKMLQARYANRLSKKDPQGSATNALNFLQGVADVGDLSAVYGAKTNEINQWYAFESQRGGYITMGKFFVDYLKANNDPRLPFYVAKNGDGLYVGSSVNTDSTALTASTASYVGPFIAGETSPIPLVTYVEALFIKAEAYLRLNNLPAASAAYDSAVLASVKMVTGANAPASFVTNFASETAGTITLQKIMMQKYLSSFINTEAWADWRRTGYPVLRVNPAVTLGAIPRRLMTVQSERTYNPNAIVVEDILKPVWWDE